MKKIIAIISLILVALLLSGYIAIYFWIDSEVKKNIAVAKEKYPGKAEDALIA